MYLPTAQAEVWGYIDDRGVAHFAPAKLDARYELFFKDARSFNTADGLVRPASAAASAAQMDIARPVPVPAAAGKLLLFFDVSPNYKAVKHLLREAAATHVLDYELLKAVISAESGFDTHAVSPKGAVGLMQLMPATAQRMGVQADPGRPIEKKLTDPKTNIFAGARYLRLLTNLYPGRMDLVLAAYNAGEGAVQRAGQQVPNFKETRDYVRTVMQLYQWLKPPAFVAEARRLKTEELERAQQAAAAAQAAEQRIVPSRVRIEQIGGAVGRGNMVPGLAKPTAPAAPATAASAP